MRRNRDGRKGKKVFLLCSFIFVAIFMGLGYSYFGDVISLEANANLYASKDYLWYKLINNFSPSSLVATQYESGKYAFVGSDPNNYIVLDTSNPIVYRIVSIEPDHTMKLAYTIPTDSEFDAVGNRTSTSTYCTDLTHGCNVYDTFSTYTNGTITGSVENSSTALNTIISFFSQYYGSIQNIESNTPIVEHAFNVGPVAANSSFSSILSQEQQKTWLGYFGFPTVSEFMFAESGNINASMSGTYNSFLVNNSQNNTNKTYWTLNPLSDNSSKTWMLNYSKNLEAKFAETDTEEISSTTYTSSLIITFYVKSSLKHISGTGTSADPYIAQ